MNSKLDQEKFELIKEAIKDWKIGNLSDYAALVAINIIISEKRKPTKEEIQYGKSLE